MSELASIPYIGEFVLRLSKDREVVLYSMIGIIVSLSFLRATLQLLSTIVDSIVKKRVETKWQDATVKTWLNAPFSCHSTDHVGKLIHVVSREVIQISHSARAFVQVVSAIIQSSVALIFLFFIAPQALILIALALTVVVVPLTLLTRRMQVVALENAHETGKYISQTHEVIRRIDLVDVYGTSDLEVNELNKKHQKYLKSSLVLSITNGLSPFVIQICLSSLLAILLIYFFEYEAEGETLALVVMFIGGLSMLNPQIEKISQGVLALTRCGAAYGEINKILNLPKREPELTSNAEFDDAVSNVLEVRDLCFSYHTDYGETKILDSVTLKLDPGKLYMLFGATGTGKTTFLRLIQKMLLPDSGEIKFSGVPLSRLSREQFSNAILLMQQDRLVFSGTIRENIAYGQSNLSDAEIWDALDKAEASVFVRKMRSGIDSETGLEGAHLSGGQRQRLALARILAAQPSVMLLDEPTSALDRDTEHHVMGNLREVADSGHTVLMSTHKVELAPLADYVLWFEDGSIKKGSFEDFQNALYALIPDERVRRAIVSNPKQELS